MNDLKNISFDITNNQILLNDSQFSIQSIDNSPQITNKEELLMSQLISFYKNPNNINTMIPIIEGDSHISLRVLDWFITNYSKTKNIHYSLNQSDFRVHNDYKSQLKAYSKKQFDPFCRRDRILFRYINGNQEMCIKTTVGQLNFFRWAIINNIIPYINDNLKEVESDMLISSKKSSHEKKKENHRIKKKINKREINITVTFD